MQQTVRGRDLVLALVVLAVFIGLSATGHRVLGFTLLLGSIAVDVVVADRARRRARRAAEGQRAHLPATTLAPTTHRTEQSVWLPHPPEQVWRLVMPAENAARLSASAKHGYRVPGTPSGVGEQRAVVGTDDGVSVVEVVELVPDRRCVARLVQPPPPVPVRVVHTVEPSDDGSVLTLASEYEAQAWQVRSDEELQGWRDYADDYFARVRSELAPASRDVPGATA